MDPSAPKRRKTSPTSSVPVESTTPPDAPPPQPSSSLSRQSPPVAAPTSSSLARNNPEIPSRTRDFASPRPDDLPASRPTSRDQDDNVDSTLTAQLELRSENNGATSSPPPPSARARAVVMESPGASFATNNGSPKSPARRIGGTTLGAQPPRRTPTRPRPRPLPPSGPGDREDIANPFMGRALHRSPQNTGVLPVVAYEEPELPPTPRHPDPVVSTPPSGIHNTPSKRRRDGIVLDTAQHSSPSKHPLSQEVVPEKPQKQQLKGGTLKIAHHGGSAQFTEDTSPTTGQETEQKTKPASKFVPGTHPRRSVRLRGRDWEKQQEQNELLLEIARLETDLKLARVAHESPGEGFPPSIDKKDILELLQRHLVPAEEEPTTDPATEWLEMAMDPIALLSFNGSSMPEFPEVIPHQDNTEKIEAPPISHHPIPMTASEELPYLQVFTPLAFTSTVTTIPTPAEQPDQPTLQRHAIRVRSATPPGLFAARLEMTVNTRTLAVASLDVPALDPAASAELQPFIKSITDGNHPALSRNVAVLCWAMGEWYRIALKRAKFWHALETLLSGDGKVEELAQAMRTRRKRGRKNGAEDESGSLDGSVGDLDGMLLSKSHLLPHMGRRSMDLEIPCLGTGGDGHKSELRVTWGVEFDWAGEARSRLGVDVCVPGKWQALDERKSIVGIPKMFDKLLQGGEDPLTAVKTVVALLAGDPGA